MNRKLTMGVIGGVVFAVLMIVLATQPSYADWNMSFQNCDEKGTWCWSITVPVAPPTPPYTPDYGHGHGHYYDWYSHYHHHHNAWCIWGHQARGIMNTGQTVHVDADYATGITHTVVNAFWSFRRQTFSCIVDPNTAGITYHCTPVPW